MHDPVPRVPVPRGLTAFSTPPRLSPARPRATRSLGGQPQLGIPQGPPKTSPARSAGEGRAPDPTGKPASHPSAEDGRAADFAVDVKGVRRSTAPTQKPYSKGSLREALRIVGSSHLRRVARKRLDAAVYSRSSLRPRKAKLRTVRRILKRMRRPFLPISIRSLSGVPACLTSGGYRSVSSYLSHWKKEPYSPGQAGRRR